MLKIVLTEMEEDTLITHRCITCKDCLVDVPCVLTGVMHIYALPCPAAQGLH